MSVLETPLARRSVRADLAAWLGERRVVLLWLAGSRAIVLTAAVAMHALHGPSGFVRADHPYRNLLGVLGTWDGRWYRAAAAQGYLLVPGRRSDPAFFPLYPLLLRVLHPLGLSYETAGIIVSNFFFCVAVILFLELGRQLFSPDRAARAAIYLAVAPLGFVFSMVYPESVALAAALASVLMARRRKWMAAGLLVAAASLARPEGAFALIPLAAIAYRQWPEADERERGFSVAAVLAAPAALLAYPAYLAWALKDPFAWSQAQQAWGRQFTVTGLYDTFANFAGQAAGHPWYARDLACVLVYAALIVVALRSGVGRGWVAAGALTVIVPLATGTVESAARFGLICPAVYWGLASVTRRRSLELAVGIGCAALLATWTICLPFANP
jgi:Mannosyltransferase (PIG-V)